MSDTSTPWPGTSGAPTESRGVGLLEVGEHVGEPAGQAVRELRRAGLRPGLERSFGHSPEATGIVIAQDPAAGSQLPRNSLVTLYVAVQASEQHGLETANGVDAPEAFQGESEDGEGEQTAAVVQREVRRRKPRPSATTERDVPAAPSAAPRRVQAPPARVMSVSGGGDGEGEVAGEPDPLLEGERDPFPPDELVGRVRDLFAAGTAKSPRVSGGWFFRARRWVRSHRMASFTIVAVLLAWGATAAVGLDSGHAPRPSAPATAPPHTQRPGRARATERRRKRTRERSARRPTRGHDTQARPAVISGEPSGSQSPSVSERASSEPQADPVPAAGASASAQAQQTGGGPFSP
jgi:hypothetical protein